MCWTPRLEGRLWDLPKLGDAFLQNLHDVCFDAFFAKPFIGMLVDRSLCYAQFPRLLAPPI